MRRFAPLALLILCLTACQPDDPSSVSNTQSQPAMTVTGEPGLVGTWTAGLVTAEPAPPPVVEPSDEVIPDGWNCNGPAYQCRGAEAEREREREQAEWLEEQEHWDRQGEEEAEAEANAPHTCEGAGIYGDYSPEGYADC